MSLWAPICPLLPPLAVSCREPQDRLRNGHFSTVQEFETASESLLYLHFIYIPTGD